MSYWCPALPVICLNVRLCGWIKGVWLPWLFCSQYYWRRKYSSWQTQTPFSFWFPQGVNIRKDESVVKKTERHGKMWAQDATERERISCRMRWKRFVYKNGWGEDGGRAVTADYCGKSSWVLFGSLMTPVYHCWWRPASLAPRTQKAGGERTFCSHVGHEDQYMTGIKSNWL